MTAIIALMSLPTFAQNKITYGIGVDVFQTQINNVNNTSFSGIGHSNPGFKQNDRLGFGATYLASIPVSKKMNLETGIGITNFRSQFRFDYTHGITGNQVKANLNIHLIYAKLPLLLSYNIPLAPSSRLNIIFGLNTRLLLLPIDNYQRIIYEFYQVPYFFKYKIAIVAPQIALGYEHTLKDKRKIRFEANASFDLTSFTNNDSPLLLWGFYENLATANYGSYGMSVKYFFTK